MKVYYPYKRCEFNDELAKYEEPGKYVITEFDIEELWKRILLPSQFFKFLKKCYFSKKKSQQFCDLKNAHRY